MAAIGKIPAEINIALLTLTPGRRLGPYEILSTLDARGMGEVYRARERETDTTELEFGGYGSTLVKAHNYPFALLFL